MRSIAKVVVLICALAGILSSDYARGAESKPPPADPKNSTIPNAPTNLVVNKLTNLVVDLDWVDSSADEIGFRIERWSSKTYKWALLKTVAAGVRASSDNTIEGGVDYLYRVRAYNAAGPSSPSNERSIDIVQVRYWIQNGGSPFPKGHPTPNGRVAVNGAVNNTPCTIPWGDPKSTSASWGTRSSEMIQNLERGKAYSVSWDITTAAHGSLESWINFEGSARIESSHSHYIHPSPGDVIYSPPQPVPPMDWSSPPSKQHLYAGTLYLPKVRVTPHHPAELNTTGEPVASGDTGEVFLAHTGNNGIPPGEAGSRLVRVDLEVLPAGMPVGSARIETFGEVELYLPSGEVLSEADLVVDFESATSSKLSALSSGPVTVYVKQSPSAGHGKVSMYYSGGGITTGDSTDLLAIEMKVVDRDDPIKKWSDAEQRFYGPIYAGKSTGDMVQWEIHGWPDATFKWSALGPNGFYDIGPQGLGCNKWNISDINQSLWDWVEWIPGIWKIKCEIVLGNGTRFQAELAQDIGVRTEQYFVVGTIPVESEDATAVTADTINDWACPNILFYSVAATLAGGVNNPQGSAYVPMDEAHRVYVNQRLLNSTSNIDPTLSIKPEIPIKDACGLNPYKHYRWFSGCQFRYTVAKNALASTPHVVGDNKVDLVGFTPFPCSESRAVGFIGQKHDDSGTVSWQSGDAGFSYLAKHRAGEGGQSGFKHLNGRELPWVFFRFRFGIKSHGLIATKVEDGASLAPNGPDAKDYSTVPTMFVYWRYYDLQEGEWKITQIHKLDESRRAFLSIGNEVPGSPYVLP